MQRLSDYELDDPYHSWIDASQPLPPHVRLYPISTRLTDSFSRLTSIVVSVGLPCGFMGYIFFVEGMWSRIDFRGQCLFGAIMLGLAGVLAWGVLTVWRDWSNQLARLRGRLRLGIFLGPEGVLIRRHPHRCHIVPRDRFVGALTRSERLRVSTITYLWIETLDGGWECPTLAIDCSASSLNKTAGQLWGRSITPPDSPTANASADGMEHAGWHWSTIVFRCCLSFGLLVGLIALLCLPSVAIPLITYLSDTSAMSIWQEAKTTSLTVNTDLMPEQPQAPLLEYSFTFQGRDFQGSRLDALGSDETFTTYQATLLETLTKASEAKQPVTVYFDPRDPKKSVLDRRLHISVLAEKMTLVSFVALWGVMMTGGPGWVLQRSFRRGWRVSEYPEQPWMWHREWADGRISSSTWYARWFIVGLILLYFLFIIPLSIMIMAKTLLVSSVFLIGGGAITLALSRQAWRNRVLDNAVLELKSIPIPLGGKFLGSVRIPNWPEEARTFQLDLRCTKYLPSRRNSSGSTIDFWTHRWTVQGGVEDPTGTMCLPINVQIPKKAQPSDPREQEAIKWILKVFPEGSEEQFAQFEIPVFRTDGLPTGSG